MTTPQHVPAAEGRLRVLAAWEPDSVRSAVGVLTDISDGWRARRIRLDELGRSLGAADCWSGSAADAAAATAVELSAVATAVGGAFARSQEGFAALAGHADRAQGLAEQALVAELLGRPDPSRAAAALVPDLVPAPPPGPVEQALAAADAAAVAARAALEALTVLAGPAGGPARTAADLLARLDLRGPLPIPALRSPRQAAAWWASLSAGAQLTLVDTDPERIGSLDGVPAWARDRANRIVLDRALDDPALPPVVALTARVVADRIAVEEAAGETVQLQVLDLAGDRVVLSLGDLDTADAVAVLVPGIGNTPADDLGSWVGNARDVRAAASAAAPAVAVAAVVWLGYRSPRGVPGIGTRTAARHGGLALASGLDGLAAARSSAGREPARMTVVAHSYGTVVADEAADVPGRLAADAVVLLGSPGMEDDAATLEAPEVYDAGPIGDPVAALGWFGIPPGADPYGSTGLPADPWTGHSEYFDADHPTLAAIGQVVTGARCP